MSFDDRQLSPEAICEYVVSRGILDKNMIAEALKSYKMLNRTNLFSAYLVEKKYVHENNMLKILEELRPNRQEAIKIYPLNQKLIDDDVSIMYSEIKNNLRGSEKELSELIEPSQKDLERLLGEYGIDWQGRKMSKEEKISLAQKIYTLKTNTEISETNGTFVLNWMKKLLET